jgi:hypothetical protein
MPDFLTSHRKETILNSDICEKLDFQLTCHYSARGLPLGEADDVTVVAPQDVTYRGRGNVMPQMHQGTLDAAVPPGGILFSHADHERFDLLRHTRSFKWSSETPPNHSLRSDKGSLTFYRNRHLPGEQRKRAELLPSLPAP